MQQGGGSLCAFSVVVSQAAQSALQAQLSQALRSGLGPGSHLKAQLGQDPLLSSLSGWGRDSAPQWLLAGGSRAPGPVGLCVGGIHVALALSEEQAREQRLNRSRLL